MQIQGHSPYLSLSLRSQVLGNAEYNHRDLSSETENLQPGKCQKSTRQLLAVGFIFLKGLITVVYIVSSDLFFMHLSLFHRLGIGVSEF